MVKKGNDIKGKIASMLKIAGWTLLSDSN